MSKEAMKLALEALEFGFMGPNIVKYNQAIKALEEALAKQEQGEPVAYIHRNEYNEYRLEPHDSFDIKSIPFNVDVPLFKSPQQRKPMFKTEGLKHKYNPHKKYPWFCADCGYAKHELLMHTAAHGIKEKNT